LIGEYYQDPSKTLFRATSEGAADNVHKFLEIVDEKANWMTLNINQIGNKRLGH
jgi:hypothetical protein